MDRSLERIVRHANLQVDMLLAMDKEALQHVVEQNPETTKKLLAVIDGILAKQAATKPLQAVNGINET